LYYDSGAQHSKLIKSFIHTKNSNGVVQPTAFTKKTD